MGGMAIGSWLAAKYGTKWKHLLLAYALAEGLIGLMGLLFHSVFADFTELAHSSLIPGIGVPWLVNTFKWTASALLILPQSILLGMTFPLMSVGIIRLFPEKPGTTLGILYFSNSIGAAVGVLVGGFVFIEWVGLPGTIRIAGLLNIILALMVWFGVVSRARTDSTSNQSITAVEKTTHKSTASDAGFGEHGFVLLLLISLFTGMASFIYEIGWIRMLSLVLGSSTHAFELMLSAFILGLALGGYAIRRYIDNRRNLLAKLGVIQLVMGLFALSTILLYNHSFDWMAWWLTALAKPS